MNRDAVRTYIEQSAAVLDSSPQMDEANTKAAVLRDFLDLLGWRIPENTQLEYSVDAFGRTYKVDYALILEGTPVAFLEAKGADTTLTADHEEQLSSYMTNKNVTYGVLTNGKQYRFFQRRVDATNVDVQKVGDIALEDLPNRLAVLNAYQKDAIESGESSKILGRINELREARQMLEADKDDLAAELSDVLSERVSETVSTLAESQAKEMIDRLVTDIDSEIDADGVSGPSNSTGGGGTDTTGNHIAGQIRRSDIEGDDDAKVAVFPAKRSGLEFLRENNAWGFVNIGQEPQFVAIYLSEDVQAVKYVAQVQDIVLATQADLARPREAYFESGSEDAQAGFDPDQRVITFEPGSLFELGDPVPFETRYPQSLRYTTLDALRTAKTTDDML
jgi:predicted type IV restriction endonuclease